MKGSPTGAQRRAGIECPPAGIGRAEFLQGAERLVEHGHVAALRHRAEEGRLSCNDYAGPAGVDEVDECQGLYPLADAARLVTIRRPCPSSPGRRDLAPILVKNAMLFLVVRVSG